MASPPRSPSSPRSPFSPRTPSSSSRSTPSPPSTPPSNINNAQLQFIEMRDRIDEALRKAPFKDPKWGHSDLKLILYFGNEFGIPMDVHRNVLTAKSGFFAEKLMADQINSLIAVNLPNSDGADIYVMAVMMMYREDLKKEFVGADVDKALRLLLVSLYFNFAAGLMLCIEYLEAIPWTDKEEDRVVSVLRRYESYPLQTGVLHRVTQEPYTTSGANDVILQVMNSVLKAEKEEVRQQLKSLLSSFLRNDVVSEEFLNQVRQNCLSSLLASSQRVANMDENMRGAREFKCDIAREADNLLWVVEILIDKNLGNEFVSQWADQKELADLHQRIPPKHRYNISRITEHLCTSMAKRFILVPCEQRYSLLDTWLKALYADFEWMSRNDRNFDRNTVEEGLCKTILTLSMEQQQSILMDWSDHFADKGDDHCPRLQKAYELWWRRVFLPENAARAG